MLNHVMEAAWTEAKRNAAVGWTAYVDDPVRFVREILRGDPAPYQSETLVELVRRRRVAVRGPHGLGKTAEAAWAVLWFASTHPDDTKIPTTASAWRQLKEYLWPEIHKWERQADWETWERLGGLRPEMLLEKLRVGSGCEAFALASDNPALIEGAHGKNLLYVFDEAKEIPPETWDAAEGAFATGNAYWLAISTPGPRAGRFYDIHRRAPGLDDWWVRHVTLNEAIAAGRISQEWAEARKRQWGEESPVYQARVLGEFPEQSEDQLISLSWIEHARQNDLGELLEVEPGKSWQQMAGADIARFGADDSALLRRVGPVVLMAETWHGNDLMSSTGKIRAAKLRTNVDSIGVGAGVVDRLMEQGHEVYGVNVAEAAIDTEHFQNLRAELYWHLRERFRDRNIDLTRLSEPMYDRLVGELAAIKFSYQSNGKLKIEAKEEARRRLGHSPDLADALMLAFCEAHVIDGPLAV
ncbi:MAG: hypothetical protein MUP86_00205 [Dehalococcoidia bacterium]|nr:hypothetical protein [Dehalococcoidia bacterium]